MYANLHSRDKDIAEVSTVCYITSSEAKYEGLQLWETACFWMERKLVETSHQP